MTPGESTMSSGGGQGVRRAWRGLGEGLTRAWRGLDEGLTRAWRVLEGGRGSANHYPDPPPTPLL